MLRVVARRYDEGRPGCHGPVGLLAGEHRARPHQHLGDLLDDGADRVLGGGGAEGDLGGGQASARP